MGMVTEFVSKELFDSLSGVVEALKDRHLELSARVAAQDTVIRALLETASDSQCQALCASIRSAAEQMLAIYDDERHGQKFRAAIGKNVAVLLTRLQR